MLPFQETTMGDDFKDFDKTLSELGIDWILAVRDDRRMWKAATRMQFGVTQVAGYGQGRKVSVALQRAVDNARSHYDALRHATTSSGSGKLAKGLAPAKERECNGNSGPSDKGK